MAHVPVSLALREESRVWKGHAVHTQEVQVWKRTSSFGLEAFLSVEFPLKLPSPLVVSFIIAAKLLLGILKKRKLDSYFMKKN